MINFKIKVNSYSVCRHDFSDFNCSAVFFISVVVITYFLKWIRRPKRKFVPGSSVGIATDYGLDGSGSNPDGDEIFAPVQTCPGAHPASCTMGTESFPGVKCGRGMLLITHPLLVPRSWKSRAIPLPTLWATPGL